MSCSGTAFPLKKSRSTFTVAEGECYAMQKKSERKIFPLYAQEALHQAPAQMGKLFMEAVPLGYTQTGRLKSAKNCPI